MHTERKVKKIKAFIRSMRGRESHYGRDKSKKIDLHAELVSVKNLRRLFLKKHPEEEQRVGYKYFLRIVCKNFRTGFGSIKTDTCSFCESPKYQIKNSTDAVTKTKLIAELTVHKRRSNVFYELINETRPRLMTFSFDHQQNLVIPRVPEQQAYYSRQFYTYNFKLVEVAPNGKLTAENATSYTWTEDSYRKDSSSCASAVFDALKNTELTGIDTIRLCADECGGQNKNTGLIYMAGHWLRKYAPDNVKKVELVFPVRGHSFLPSDRVIGLVELDIRNVQCIYLPSEYHDIFAKHSSVKKAGTDWPVLDFKKAADVVLKKPFPLGIQDNKHFYIHKTRLNSIKVSAEASYRNITNMPAVVTKAKKTFLTEPSVVAKGHLLIEAKKKDVRSLKTAHCGKGWMDNDDDRFSYMKDMVRAADDENQSEHGCEEEGEHALALMKMLLL